jgi:hypothetical protein
MAHFAKLDENNIVTIVTVGRQEDDGKEQELSDRTGDVYKQTSYNTSAGQHFLGGVPLRKNFAGIGFSYDEARDAFIPPKPFDSWLLDEGTCIWTPPTPRPNDGLLYFWDEAALSWVEMVFPPEDAN